MDHDILHDLLNIFPPSSAAFLHKLLSTLLSFAFANKIELSMMASGMKRFVFKSWKTSQVTCCLGLSP